MEEAGYNNLIKYLTAAILVACDFINGCEAAQQSFAVDFNEIVGSRQRRTPWRRTCGGNPTQVYNLLKEISAI